MRFYRKTRHTLLQTAIVVSLAVVLAGCAAPAVLATSGTTAAFVANDERSAGSLVEDQGIELKAAFLFDQEFGVGCQYQHHELQSPRTAYRSGAQ